MRCLLCKLSFYFVYFGVFNCFICLLLRFAIMFKMCFVLFIHMAKNKVADLESFRLNALREGDSFEYYSLCKKLGYKGHAIEDPDLYHRGYLVLRDCNSDLSCIAREPSSPVEVDNSTLFNALKIVFPFIFNNSDNGRRYVTDFQVNKRLRAICATGYPVQSHSNLKGHELLGFYLNVKGRIIRLARDRSLVDVRGILF